MYLTAKEYSIVWVLTTYYLLQDILVASNILAAANQADEQILCGHKRELKILKDIVYIATE